MSDGKLELTRRRVLAGILVIGLAAAAAGVGTFALFTDTETSSANNVTAGTLDLTVDSTESTIVDVAGQAPEDSGTEYIQVTNDGSLDGSLDVNVGTSTHIERGNAGPEQDTSTPGDLNVSADIYVSSDSTLDSNDPQVASGHIWSINDTEYNTNYELTSSESAYIFVDWEIPTSVGNEAQGDAVEFAIEAELNQQDSQ